MSAADTGLSFLGIGAQKAGTTWLHKMLRLHPDIGMPEQKELHFWDRESPDATSIAAYRSLFLHLHGRARGEITPSYAMLPRERIALVRRAFPEVRLIYILRNPVERAWSQAKMELSRRFPTGVPTDFRLYPWLEIQFRSESSLARGDYAACLRNWLMEFPREQLQVSTYEELRQAPRDFLETCSGHIGVDAGFYTRVTDEQLADRIYPELEILGIPRLELPEMPPPEHIPLLIELYKTRIGACEEILGREFAGLWLGDYL